MSKTLKLTANGKTYELEYTKASVKQMEDRGFNLKVLEEKPVNGLQMLFMGAFIAHHADEKIAVINNIYDKIANKEDCLRKLYEMYNEPLEAMFDEPDADDEGKATWETDW